MKILFVMDEFFAVNNGMSISAQRFAAELTRRGHEVRVLAGSATGAPDYPLWEYRMPVFDRLIKKQGMTFARADRTTIRRAVEWAELVHLENCFVLASRAAKTARALSKPCTGSFHIWPENITSSLGLAWCEPLNGALFGLFRHWVYRYCSDVHCPSEVVRRRLQEHGYTARLHVVSNGVTPEYVPRIVPKPSALQDRFVILSTGRYSREKRQDVLLEAAQRSRHADQIQLIFAGQGPLEARYRRQARELAHPPLFGFQSKEALMQTMGCADLYVHTAQAEVEGMSCLEAIASGLVPVIAQGPKTATAQFALDDRSRFSCGNAGELADRLDYWIEHDKERRDMGRQYAQFARSYAIDRSAAALERMFRTAYEDAHG